MANIDIDLSKDVKELLDLPPCVDLTLPKPSPLSVQLPTGGTLKAFSDVSKAIPTDCSLTFSLLVQVAPLLASMECLLKILKLLKPLIDVINGLPMPPVQALIDFGKAAADLKDCLLIPTPGNLIPFVRDLLCLILKVLRCFVGELKSIVGLMSGLKLQLDAAHASGNAELVSALECAQGNAAASAGALMQSIEPIGALLGLASTVMGLAQIKAIELPSLAPSTDVDALNGVVQTMQGVVDTLQTVVDSLGGCQ